MRYAALRGMLLVVALGAGACARDAEPTALPEMALQAVCTDPAPLLGTPDPRAPGYIVAFHEGTDAVQETERLAEKYGFTPTHIYTGTVLTGFSAVLSKQTVEAIRCEPTVKSVTYDSLEKVD